MFEFLITYTRNHLYNIYLVDPEEQCMFHKPNATILI